MTPTEKSHQLIDKMFTYVPKSNGLSELVYAKFLAIACIKEIIQAIKTTTGHCELRKLDWQEVQMDIEYWERSHAWRRWRF